MNFKTASLVETIIWKMKLADLGRSTNRALIDRLFNGFPPLNETERRQQNAKTNVNFLDAPKLAADARRTYYGAFIKPTQYFNVTLDSGPLHKRDAWARTITTEINHILKNSRPYYETLKSQLAMTVLHGIGPVSWSDKYKWCPTARGIEDVLIPGNTRLSFDNLTHYAEYVQYTPMELRNLTHGPKVDPGWNMPVVKAALKWVEEQTQKTTDMSEMYSPEKREERWKEDSGFYGSDVVPTINAWNFYFWSDEGKQAGWRRRMILDTPATGEDAMPKENGTGQKSGQWLYNPGDKRIYAEKSEQIIHFQFGDASAVAPFKYHTVRSLGWLLYAVCHLQNRVRCKLNDATFESLMQYFRVSNPDDKERLTKIDLHNFGVIPEGTTMVTQNERWTVNQQLSQLALNLNRESMNEAAAQFREGRDSQGSSGKEKTATQVMAEVNSANALIGAMLLQSYEYAKYQYREICRRFCIKNSNDPDVKRFRLKCLKAGIDQEMLDSTRWNVEPERVIGNGNKILEVAMADKLMAIRPQLPPGSQRKVDHIYVMANSDKPDLADNLVPEQIGVSSTVHDAQLMLGTLMAGIPVLPTPQLNAIEVVHTLLMGAANVMKGFTQTGLPTPAQILGLQTVAQAIGQWLAQLAQDKSAQPMVKQFGEQLKELSGIIQQLQEAVQEKQQSQHPQGGESGAMDQADSAKAATIVAMSQVKIKAKQDADAQKLQQRAIQFEQKLKQDEQKLDAALDAQLKKTELDALAKGIETGSQIANQKIEEPTGE